MEGPCPTFPFEPALNSSSSSPLAPTPISHQSHSASIIPSWFYSSDWILSLGFPLLMLAPSLSYVEQKSLCLPQDLTWFDWSPSLSLLFRVYEFGSLPELQSHPLRYFIYQHLRLCPTSPLPIYCDRPQGWFTPAAPSCLCRIDDFTNGLVSCVDFMHGDNRASKSSGKKDPRLWLTCYEDPAGALLCPHFWDTSAQMFPLPDLRITIPRVIIFVSQNSTISWKPV